MNSYIVFIYRKKNFIFDLLKVETSTTSLSEHILKSKIEPLFLFQKLYTDKINSFNA